uniref:Alpha-defensin N-terminal domain-containing protein n=1 Tax=Prolemur simus TaxID=1328070 RepID=A0A8C8YKT1_PROSS
MRTLALLAALLLLALQAQAGPLQERAEEAPKQEQPDTEDQDMAISFAGDESLAAGSTRGLTCYCRTGRCRLLERIYGSCIYAAPRTESNELIMCCETSTELLLLLPLVPHFLSSSQIKPS